MASTRVTPRSSACVRRSVEVSTRMRLTVRAVAEAYLAANADAWRNAKHRAQWTSTMKTYAYPHMGALPAQEVTTGHVLSALEPIWRSKAETAARLRGRIETVLDYATARQWRSGENPARWRGHLAILLPARGKVAPQKHHAALPWGEVGEFLTTLHKQAGMGARALEFTILTAARSGEVLGSTWGEIDLAAKLWTVPAVRMKAGREHRVPLSDPAMALLAKVARLRTDESPDAFVFPGQPKRPLSIMAMTMTLRRLGRGDITVHGFRSTFRDWAGEATTTAREVAEAALAHTLGSKVEAAYARADLLEKRRSLMAAWGAFCSTPLKRAASTAHLGDLV